MKLFEILKDVRYKIACLEDRIYGISKRPENTPFTLKQWRKDFETELNWKERHPVFAYFINLFNYFLWRLPDLPRDIYSKIYWFIQRGKRGYSDNDVWNFYSYLANVISEGTEQLRKEAHGHPIGLTPKKWDKILKQISEGFSLTHQCYTELESYLNNEKTIKKLRRKNKDLYPTKTEVKKVDKAFKLFQKYFCNLWD